MNKKLSLLRHGEAEIGIGSNGDFQRNLSETGISKLIGLNSILKERGTHFDLLIKSPALRAIQTAQLVLDYLDVKEERIEEGLYEGSVGNLLEILYQIPDHFDHVLIVGHNPGLSSLLVYLTNDFNLSLLPGMMAVISFDLPEWGMLSKGSGSLVEVFQ